MKKTIFLPLALVSLLVFGLGCNTEKPATLSDTEAPEIFFSHPRATAPGEYTHYYNNEDINLDIRFEDDVELKDYIIEISNAQELYFLKTNNDFWETTLMGDLSGNSDGLNTIIPVKNDPSAGPHEVRVTLEDQSGKITVKSTYIFIWNDRDTIVPTVTITMPDTTDVDTFDIGSSINVRGNLSDPSGVILDGFIWIKNKLTREIVEGSRISFDTLNLATYNYNEFVSSPLGIPEGDYIIETYGRDLVSNHTGARSYIYLK